MVRDEDGVEIDPNYESQFIPEHMIDGKRWPIGRKKELSSGSNGKHTRAMKNCACHFDPIQDGIPTIIFLPYSLTL